MSKYRDTQLFRVPAPAIHRRHVLGLGAGAVAAMAGFGSQAQTSAKPVPPPPSKPTGQIVVGLYQEPTAFNPLMPGIEVDEDIWMQVFNTLWVADPQGNLIPDLAVEIPTKRMAEFPRAASHGRSSCAMA